MRDWLGFLNPFIPLTFDKEISYLEMVGKLLNRVNELNEYVNSILTKIGEYTDKEIAKVRKDFDIQIKSVYNVISENYAKLDNKIDDNYNTLENKIITTKNELIVYIDEETTKLNNKIERYYKYLIQYIDSGDNATKLETLIQINRLKNNIDKINENGFKIWNPTNGKKNHVEQVVNDIYDALRFCLTCGDFEVLPITIEQVEQLTVHDFELYSKWILQLKERYLIISPSTGDKVTHQFAINQLYDFWQWGSYPAQEFDNLDFTTEEIDNKEISAYNFDFHLKRFLA